MTKGEIIGFIVIKRGPYVEPRRLNTSPSTWTRLLWGKWTLKEPNTLVLNWNRQDLYIRNGIHMGSRWNKIILQAILMAPGHLNGSSYWIPWEFVMWAATCDFQQCGILTSADYYEPVKSPFKLGNSKWCSVSSITLIENSSDKQRLWSDCVYAQADLILCWSNISHCWKNHVAAHFKGATMHVAVGVWLKTLSRRDVTL